MVMTMSIATNVTNNYENDKEDRTNSSFEYCILSESFEPPVICLSFQYTNSSDTDADNDDYYGDYCHRT
jgi:hypothetical protein